MQATIVYITARAEPRLDWTIDGLELQAEPADDLQLIVVDSYGRPAAEIGFRPIDCVTDLVEVKPKPTPWQGPQRVTRRDFWAASSARNTGITLCDCDYVAFLDDRSRLGDRWLEALRDAERSREAVVAGSYDRLLGRGAHRTLEQDHRATLHPTGLRGCPPGWLYGCAVALPLAWCLDVNGFEEGCDGVAGEDCVLGLMLANARHRIDFDPRLMVHQDRTEGTGHDLTRAPQGVPTQGKALAALERFRGRDRTEFTPDLRELRARLAAGGRFPTVDSTSEHRDWYDGRRLSELP